MRRLPAIALLFMLLAGCNFPGPTPPVVFTPPAETPAPLEPSPAVTSTSPPTPPAATPLVTPVERPTPAGSSMEPFLIPNTFTVSNRSVWQPAGRAMQDFALPLDLSLAVNQGVIAGLTPEQHSFLAQNGFVVIQSQEAQFTDLRERVGRFYGQPVYLTADMVYHSLHITFDKLLEALEREHLRPRLARLVQAVLDEVLTWLPDAEGAPIEKDAALAAGYLSVAYQLLEPQAQIDERVAEAVAAQIDQIQRGEGQQYSVLIPGFQDDYGAYKPVGHYAGDPELEAYFQAMTWFGRVHFPLKEAEVPPSRAPLIITLALRRAEVESSSAASEWGQIHELLTFLIGESDDGGPAEYAALMDEIYSPEATIVDLADEGLWNEFLARQDEIPAPRINSTFVNFLEELEQERGWRFMGQRFTIDSFVLQNMVFNRVGTEENPRKLPSGLDVMAALGSQPALDALEAAGETAYQNYPAQMTLLQQTVAAQTEPQWSQTFYQAWLYAFLPQLVQKDSAYPSYMQTEAWGYKDLNSALGSWAELKHDTALYTKMPEFAGGGGPPSSGPAPGYVEPNPEVFYRMADSVRALSDGLTQRLFVELGESGEGLSLGYIVNGLPSFAEDLAALGSIAARELAGSPLTEDDAATIQGCLGPVECYIEYMKDMAFHGVGPGGEMPPVPVVAAVAGAENLVLQVGVGQVDRIYVVVPVEGQMQIAQGGVFSYYEFPQPRSDRLTDEEWRQQLESDSPARPAWTAHFLLPGGEPVDVLAFRVGDVYLITEEGADLNVRDRPTTSGRVLEKLQPGDYIEIVEGPVDANGYRWWKLREPYGSGWEGWSVEHQEWYERAWGQ